MSDGIRSYTSPDGTLYLSADDLCDLFDEGCKENAVAGLGLGAAINSIRNLQDYAERARKQS